MLTTTLDTHELEFLIRRIDEYIQVMEFMIRKTPALDQGELTLARKLSRKLSPWRRGRSSAEEPCEQARLGRASLVSMMKSAHLRKFYDKTVLRPVDCSGLRRIFGQG